MVVPPMKRRRKAKATPEVAPEITVSEVPKSGGTSTDFSTLASLLQPFKTAWDQEGAKKNINSILSAEMMKAFGSDVAPKGPEEDRDTPAPSEAESLLSSAVANGNFATDMSSKLGKLWNDAKRNDPTLAAAYKAVGKVHAAQRAFRLKWANKEADKMKKERIHMHTQELLGQVKGKYKTFGMIWAEEGKDAIGFDVACNVLQSCWELHSKGRSLYGRPWLRINNQKKYPEFLVTEESVELNDKEMLMKAQLQLVEALELFLEALLQPLDMFLDAQLTYGCRSRALIPWQRGKAKKQLTPEQKLALKSLLKDLAALSKLKVSVAQARQDCSELMTVIASNKTWEYMNNESFLKPMRDARDKLETFKATSQFWSDVMIQDDFPKYARTNYKPSEIRLALAKKDEFVELCEALATETSNLKRMHASRKPTRK
ncbi:unnamed protein product [Prorocentrum cordatum]|uniref:Uncharacterized protein n=1 Tax=Prorocentrum cordatum TaxID=2364126 RepID=A0ABN9Y098_9DINO|nr:unnamed protein product [Polarella glacialis]